MKPKKCTARSRLSGWMDRSAIRLNGMDRQLQSLGNEIPPEFSEIEAAVMTCHERIDRLSEQILALQASDKDLMAYWQDDPLSDAEISQLLALNKRLAYVTHHLRVVAEDVEPRLEAKLADPCDPMSDYEIDALLHFVLREDDPDFDEDCDNFIATRDEYLKHLPPQELESFAESDVPKGLLMEPHCWLFHDLYDHDHGIDSPRVSLRDCLRIGAIRVDVQVTRQYDFDVNIVHAHAS